MPAEEREPVSGVGRRSLLLAGIAVTAAPAAAAAQETPASDVELLEIGRQIEGLYTAISLVWEDGVRITAAYELNKPEPPDALLKRSAAEEVHGWGGSGRNVGGDCYGDSDVSRARQHLSLLDQRAAAGDQHARAAAARAREVVDAYSDWRRRLGEARADSGVEGNWDHADALRRTLVGLSDRALRLRAHGREALLVKARLVHWHSPLNYKADPDQEEPEWEAFASLLADLQGSA